MSICFMIVYMCQLVFNGFTHHPMKYFFRRILKRFLGMLLLKQFPQFFFFFFLSIINMLFTSQISHSYLPWYLITHECHSVYLNISFIKKQVVSLAKEWMNWTLVTPTLGLFLWSLAMICYTMWNPRLTWKKIFLWNLNVWIIKLFHISKISVISMIHVINISISTYLYIYGP